MASPVFDDTQPRSGSTLVAVGDGMADDTAAIQDRLDEASSNARGTVYFPPGNYRITQTLHKSNLQPVTIRGEGFSSRLNWTFDGDLFVWDNSATDTQCRLAQYRQNAALRAPRTLPRGGDHPLSSSPRHRHSPSWTRTGLRHSQQRERPVPGAGKRVDGCEQPVVRAGRSGDEDSLIRIH